MLIQVCVVIKYFIKGWRYFMEDAHIATSLTYIQNYLFGIFDGHGG